jgi:hypothetical protein
MLWPPLLQNPSILSQRLQRKNLTPKSLPITAWFISLKHNLILTVCSVSPYLLGVPQGQWGPWQSCSWLCPQCYGIALSWIPTNICQMNEHLYPQSMGHGPDVRMNSENWDGHHTGWPLSQEGTQMAPLAKTPASVRFKYISNYRERETKGMATLS